MPGKEITNFVSMATGKSFFSPFDNIIAYLSISYQWLISKIKNYVQDFQKNVLVWYCDAKWKTSNYFLSNFFWNSWYFGIQIETVVKNDNVKGHTLPLQTNNIFSIALLEN